MADEALFLLLHNEMVSGVYKSAEQGEVVSVPPRTLGSCGTPASVPLPPRGRRRPVA